MADPLSHTRIPTNPESWNGRILRQLTEAQTAHWRFRLFGPLTSATARTVDRPEPSSRVPAAAKQTFA